MSNLKISGQQNRVTSVSRKEDTMFKEIFIKRCFANFVQHQLKGGLQQIKKYRNITVTANDNLN